MPEHVDPRLCTHIVYAYASLDPNELRLKPFDTTADIDNSKKSIFLILNLTSRIILPLRWSFIRQRNDKCTFVKLGYLKRAFDSQRQNCLNKLFYNFLIVGIDYHFS